MILNVFKNTVLFFLLVFISCGSKTKNEIIKNNETGYIVDYGNLIEFADRLQDLVVDVDKRSQFGNNARAFAEENFRIEDQVDKMIKNYKKIAGIN